MAAHLERPEVQVAGPQIFAIPGADTLLARTIAWCLNTRLGNGCTPGRNPLGGPCRVHHAPMSCWHRSVWERIGGFDERLLSNEDFDFDWRAHLAGCGVWSFPAPHYRIIARSTLATLAAQRWRYGTWKAQVLRLHPRSLSLRQAMPIAMPPLALGLAITVSLMPALWPWLALAIGSGALLVALGVLLAPGRAQPPDRDPLPRALAPRLGAAGLALLIYPTLHLVWAAGVWRGWLAPPALRQPATVPQQPVPS
jgi:hypothetical protein